jgi:hypothetical protein
VIAIAVVAGVAPGMWQQRDAWAARAGVSTSSSIEGVGNGRIALAKQALVLADDHPLEQRPDLVGLSSEYKTVHAAPLQILVENGVLGAALMCVFGVALAQRVRRRGPALLIGVGLLPLLLLDSTHWDGVAGIFQLSVAIAAMLVLSDIPSDIPSEIPSDIPSGILGDTAGPPNSSTASAAPAN